MLKKTQKHQIVKELTEELRGINGAIFTSFQGLPAREMQALRKILRSEGVRSKVVKLTLLRRALSNAGVDTNNFEHNVPLVLSYSREDEIVAARLLYAFAKKQGALKIVAGVLDQKLVDASAVKALATLPGRQELLGQLASVLAGPLRGIATVLSGNIRGLINVLNAKSRI